MVVFFYMFAFFMIIGSVFVVFGKNTVHSVLWLMLIFCNAAGLFLLIGAEFLSMMLMVVYVGAVAILFLFVIMMLNTKLEQSYLLSVKNIFLNISCVMLLLANLIVVVVIGANGIKNKTTLEINNLKMGHSASNIHAISNVLYTEFLLPFQISGIILFVVIIACIWLTKREFVTGKVQNIHKQLSHNKNIALSKVNVNNDVGINNIKYE